MVEKPESKQTMMSEPGSIKWLDNPVAQAVIVIVVVVVFILILAWRLGGLKDFELGEYQPPLPLQEILKNPDAYINQEEVKVGGVLREATESADFVLVHDHQELLVRPKSGLHANEFVERGEVGVGGVLKKEDSGLVLDAISFEVIDLDADAARARAKLMADKVKSVLAGELGIDQGQFRTEEARELDWPDTSLGAAESGKVYAQTVTQGYQLKFNRGEVLYEIHTNKEGSQVIQVLPTRKELPPVDQQQ
jgi:hypothetical protein